MTFMQKHNLELTVNGVVAELSVEANRTLLEVLREELSLTGTKYGCGCGDCGACTVLVDNKPTLSCLTLAMTMHGKHITTIEGLAKEGKLDRLQQAFLDQGAVQCGYCSPGMILSAKALLEENPDPTEAEVKEAIKGNLCRCGGYVKIIRAILSVAKNMKAHK